MPNVWRMRSATSSGATDGPGTTSMRPMSAFTLVLGRSATARRRLRTSWARNQGRFFPLRAISW